MKVLYGLTLETMTSLFHVLLKTKSTVKQLNVWLLKGVICVSEGANGKRQQCHPKFTKENGIYYGPAKAANAGGVYVSALEKQAKTVFASHGLVKKLMDVSKDIMTNIFNTAKTTAETYGLDKDYLAGANIAAFENVANAMITEVLFRFILVNPQSLRLGILDN